MRFIDTSTMTIPETWLDLAKAKLGKNHDSLWSYLKKDFEQITPKKCWFSESENIGSDNVIEHFRPKGTKVLELKSANADLDEVVWLSIDAAPRDGYPYLQYTVSNYRYACTFVNSLRTGQSNKSRGKTNFFPLKKDSPCGTCTEDYNTEVNCLLDPCKIGDSEYLTFNEIGEIQPNVSLPLNSWEYCRVKVSIEVYHLHYYLFRDARLQIWDSCKQNIELAHQLQLNLTTELEIKNFKYHLTEINKKIAVKAQYSAVSIDCIKFHIENGYEWLQTFFDEQKLRK